MDFLFALLLSFLPPHFRRPFVHHARTHVVRASAASGFFEIVLVAILYARGFIEYIPRASIGPPLSRILFLIAGMLLALFFVDGAIRAARRPCRQSLGIIPLYVVAWLDEWRSLRAKKKEQLPLISDLVEPDGGDGLRISSCRTRKNWDKWLTVMYEEKLYEIANAEIAAPPRPYVYLLRPKPESKVIRGLHRYHPEEVFHLEDQ